MFYKTWFSHLHNWAHSFHKKYWNPFFSISVYYSYRYALIEQLVSFLYYREISFCTELYPKYQVNNVKLRYKVCFFILNLEVKPLSKTLCIDIVLKHQIIYIRTDLSKKKRYLKHSHKVRRLIVGIKNKIIFEYHSFILCQFSISTTL